MSCPDPTPYTPGTHLGPDKVRAFEPISAASLDGLPVPPRRWHVADLLPARTVTMLSGDGGTGKSLLALQRTVFTVLDRPWIGQPVTAGRALFLSAEDDLDELHRRLADVVAAEGVRLADLDALSIKSRAGADALLATPDGAGKLLRETALCAAVSGWIGKHRPALVVLDTLADLFGGDAVNRSQARQFIGILRWPAPDHDCAVLLQAHPSLSGLSRSDGASRSTGWNNPVRSRLYRHRVQMDGEGEDAPDLRALAVGKANYGRKGGVLRLRWQGGVFVPDPAGGDTGPDRMAAGAKAQRAALALLRECHDNGRRVNHTGGNTHAPRVFAVHPAAEGVTKAGFRTAMETALATGTARVGTEGLWSRRVSFLVPAGDA